MDTVSKFSLPLFLFLLTLVFGFWLSRLGKPYNGILFNTHKLVALAVVVLAVIQISKTGAAGSPLLVAALVVGGLCAAALFVSGALMSAEKWNYNITLTVHRIALAALIIASGPLVCLLNVK